MCDCQAEEPAYNDTVFNCIGCTSSDSDSSGHLEDGLIAGRYNLAGWGTHW